MRCRAVFGLRQVAAFDATLRAWDKTHAAANPRGGGLARARPHRRVAPPRIRFAPDSRTRSAPLFLKRQCGRAPGGARREGAHAVGCTEGAWTGKYDDQVRKAPSWRRSRLGQLQPFVAVFP
jgi:hypothetical protein